MKTGVLIPCYNGAVTISSVVVGVLTKTREVIVVDDGSADDSYTIAKNAGAEVLRHPENQGKGAALKTGFEYIKQFKNWEGVILMDADGQHDYNEIPDFIAAAEEQPAGIILGNRMANRVNMPCVRWWTNRITSFVTSKICQQKIPDSQCGYRLIKREVLRRLSLTAKRFDIESEMLIKTAALGYSIYSIPVKTIYKEEHSYIRPIRDTFRFIKLVMVYYAAIFRT